MKKVTTILAAISIMALSCNKETPASENGSIAASGKLTATIVPTKVAYAETSEMNLQPSWEVGDEIIGFDDAGNTYTLSVASVAAKTATLSGTVPDGALHLIYKSGAKASDIANKTLAIDYTNQKGDKTMPAVMLADGTVEDGACDFAFTNASAIIGISAVNGIPSGSTITKITVVGRNLSGATASLNGSALELTATTVASDTIRTATLSGVEVIDTKGTLSVPVLLAVPAGARISMVSASVVKEPETMTIPSTASDKEGIDYVTIAGVKWAKWNVGANGVNDCGWYFPWAGIEGYVRCGDTWQPAQDAYVEFSYSPSSARTASAGSYLYINTQIFNGYRFDWPHAPYHKGYESINSWKKYIPSAKASYWSGGGTPDNKTVLDMEDDAARANWGGTWRMPTSGEFIALHNACTIGSLDKTTYASTSCGESTSFAKGIYFCANYDGTAGLLFCDGAHKLFLPAAGYCTGDNLYSVGSLVRYWSSTLCSSQPNQAFYFFYWAYTTIELDFYYNRRDGFSVRPVSD